MCPQATTKQCDAVIQKVAVSVLGLCTRNSIMLGLIIGQKNLFEKNKNKKRECVMQME